MKVILGGARRFDSASSTQKRLLQARGAPSRDGFSPREALADLTVASTASAQALAVSLKEF